MPRQPRGDRGALGPAQSARRPCSALLDSPVRRRGRGGPAHFAIASGVDGFDATNNFAQNGWGEHSPGGYDLAAAVVVEIAFTALLVFVVASTSHSKFPAAGSGIAIGLTLGLIHLATIPVDNTSVNPARSFASALFAGADAWEQLWAFIVFPLVGGVIGAGLWWLVREPRETTT
jgi:aquaporin Z